MGARNRLIAAKNAERPGVNDIVLMAGYPLGVAAFMNTKVGDTPALYFHNERSPLARRHVQYDVRFRSSIGEGRKSTGEGGRMEA